MTQTHLAGSDVETVVVGVKLDVQSRELLTWCLVKLVKPGDRLIAVHVMGHDEGVDPNGKSSFLSVVGAFDSVLNVYEGFCNLKQVDLKLKICRGSSIGTILVREAHSYSASKLIFGTKHHKIKSSASVAKYCANNLSKNCSLLAVNNGKIIFERVASTDAAKTKNSEGTDKHQRKTLLSILSRSTSFRLNLNSGVNNCAICNPDPIFSSGLQDSDPCLLSPSSVAPLMMQLPSKDLVSNPNSKMTQKNFDDEDVDSDMDGENGDLIQDDANLPLDLAALHERYSSTCRLFSYQELQSATSNFAPENLIGKGGSSQVYRGNLPNGKEIAVKILRQSEDVIKEFVLEIDITTSLHHKNIISLFGFCFENNNKLLVYNLLPRGSLEEILHGKKNTVKFGWNERYKVAMGIAKALNYLHEFTSQTIIHRDVKSSNILLSDDFEPKLSDFGLAKRTSASTKDTVTDIAGTFGYLAPECFMYGKVTGKVDVYAYGVVLLELLSGRKPISSDHPKGQESLVMWAKPMLNEGKITELLDPSLGPNHDLEMLERMILAANLCIRLSPQSRPKMSLVLKLIQGDKETMNWGRMQVNVTDSGLEKSFCDEGHLCPSSIQCHLNIALLDVEDDSVSVSSIEQNVCLNNDYLRGRRCSRSNSFD